MAGVCEGECMGLSSGDEPLNLTRCYSFGLSQQYEAFEGWKSICGRACKLKGIMGKISVILLHFNLRFSFTVAHFMARFILVLRGCIWNAPVVSLVFPAFDDTSSLGSPRQVV